MLVCPGYVHDRLSRSMCARAQPPDGVMRARRFAITRRRVRAAIRRGVERDARTVVAPRAGWLLVAAARLFPRIVEARMAEMNGTA